MTDAPILIVGAGPVGFVAALCLARAGIPTILVEKEDRLQDDLRASTFHPPTLEMLDSLGLTRPLLERGLKSPTWQVRLHETNEKAEFDLAALADDTRYPFRLQAEQRVLCELAADVAAAEPRIDFRLGTALTGLEQTADRVIAAVRAGDGTTDRIDCPFLIGADGARSRVRELVGLDFTGLTYPETTILVTVDFPFEAHLPGLSNVNYVWYAGGTFSLLRLPDIWRCSLYPDDDEPVEAAIAPDSIERKLQRIVAHDAHYPVREIRPYRIHQRIVSNYRQGRVLLAGDAAHLNSPSGGMGMNGGIHDAFNLAEKLSAVCIDGAPANSLDRYTRQRRPVAEQQILGQAHANRTRMQERDAARRRTELKRLQAIAADPAAAREYLLRSSMIAGLREAARIS